jgi:hypothetical protein
MFSRMRSVFPLVIVALFWPFVSTSADSPKAVPKNGPCPNGYQSDGDYCVSYQ